MIDSGSSMKPGGPKVAQQSMSPETAASKVEAKLRNVSNLYEKQFLREMMKAMRSTVHEGGFIKTNQAEKIFRDQLDDQYVDKWSDKGGIGLSDLIYNQLVEKFGPRLGLKAPVQKPSGPLPLDSHSEFRSRAASAPTLNAAGAPSKAKGASGLSTTWQFDRELVGDKKPEPSKVTAPWDGILLGGRRLDDDHQLVELAHDNGLKSRLVYRGSAERLNPGQPVQAGETLGVLSGEARSLFWTVQDDGKAAQDVDKNAAE